MAEEPIDLIRLEGEGSSVVLWITGSEEGEGPGRPDVLTGEFRVDTPFVRGSLGTRLLPEDLRQWQQALDTLDVGQDITWREDARAPWLAVEHGEGGEDGEYGEDGDRCRVTVGDPTLSLTTVTVTVGPLTDTWFDEAYRRLEAVWKTWPLNEG